MLKGLLKNIDPSLEEAARDIENWDQDNDGGYQIVEKDDNTYRLYSRTFKKNDESFTLQVFQQITAERYVISYVITFLFLIGAFGI